jgi:hypothetical protein
MTVATPRQRDPRLDVFRGISLVMIYINHVPGTVFEHLTSRNFGFSDAAEGFVIMSGIAAGLAYSSGFVQPPVWPQIRKVWHRVWVLYLVHLLSTLLSIAVVAGGAVWLGTTAMLEMNNFRPIYANPLGTQIGIPLLTHQIGYANILPMYAVLLLVTPFAILIGLRFPRALLAGGVALWAWAGMNWISLPNYPNSGGWFFNPLSWQVIFVTGLLVGMAMRRGETFFPVRRWAQGLAVAYLVIALATVTYPPFAARVGAVLWFLEDHGVHRQFTAFDKTFLTLPRLLHILALAYFLGSLTTVSRWAGSSAMRPFALLGRHSLPVFALGTVLAYTAQVIREATPDSFLLDAAVIGCGIALLFAMAWAKDRIGRTVRFSRAKGIPAPANVPALADQAA